LWFVATKETAAYCPNSNGGLHLLSYSDIRLHADFGYLG